MVSMVKFTATPDVPRVKTHRIFPTFEAATVKISGLSKSDLARVGTDTRQGQSGPIESLGHGDFHTKNHQKIGDSW